VTVGLIYIDVHLGHPRWPGWLTVVLLVPLAGFALYRVGRTRVSVGEDGHGQPELRVGPATLPVRLVADVSAVAVPDKQEALGPALDPIAYVLHKPWIGPMIRVTLADPSDPTPYWLFSTRHPETLLECLRASSRSDDQGANPE
jgi:hypothetical protein